jgi:large subunit ribosomal protein L27
MSKVKAGGTSKNLTDSKPKFLGVKVADGQTAKAGSIIVRQRGTRYLAGTNTDLGKDHTIFATKAGVVKFSNKRKVRFDGKTVIRKLVQVI